MGVSECLPSSNIISNAPTNWPWEGKMWKKPLSMLRFRSSEASQLCSRRQRSECSEQNYPLPASDWGWASMPAAKETDSLAREHRVRKMRLWVGEHGNHTIFFLTAPAHECSFPASRPPSLRELIGLNWWEHLRKSQTREDPCSISDLNYNTGSFSPVPPFGRLRKLDFLV